MTLACHGGATATRGSSSGSGSERAGSRAATRSASTRRPRASGSGRSSCSRSRPASRGRGSCRRPASRPTGRTASAARSRSSIPTTWRASSTAGSSRPRSPATCSGSTRSTSPTCRRRRTRRARCSRPASPTSRRSGSLDELLGQAGEGDYVCIQAFIDPAREQELEPLLARAHETGCVVTNGLGPRYLHSTGQLHKGGPNTGLFVQVVDETGDELAIPGRDFGFGRLIRSQAAGDFAALEERGRRAIRIRLEDL